MIKTNLDLINAEWTVFFANDLIIQLHGDRFTWRTYIRFAGVCLSVDRHIADFTFRKDI